MKVKDKIQKSIESLEKTIEKLKANKLKYNDEEVIIKCPVCGTNNYRYTVASDQYSCDFC